ncbi:MAG: VTT domain-containing protein [Deltaproteobacteria bacterium]|nr:VTT domain-containing protein [Deltaproteobacteria bacterium]MDQ3301466.1 VTT domain-containing protein [Myxococcota bacterium]
MFDSIEAAVGIYLASLVIGVVSGVIPVVNAELYLIGVVLLGNSVPGAIVLGTLVALGQMIAKAGLYQAARGAGNAGKRSKLGDKIEKARARLERWKSKPLTITFVSAVTGLPPFFLVSLVAGLLEVRFVTFCVLGFVGRTIRFVTIALLAVLV